MVYIDSIQIIRCTRTCGRLSEVLLWSIDPPHHWRGASCCCGRWRPQSHRLYRACRRMCQDNIRCREEGDNQGEQEKSKAFWIKRFEWERVKILRRGIKQQLDSPEDRLWCMSILSFLPPDCFCTDILSSTSGGQMQLWSDVRERNTRIRYWNLTQTCNKERWQGRSDRERERVEESKVK